MVLEKGWPWVLALIGAVVARAIVRRYWSSIRDIPGPWLASVSGLWQVLQILRGHTEKEVIKLHKQHGMLVPHLYPCSFSFQRIRGEIEAPSDCATR